MNLKTTLRKFNLLEEKGRLGVLKSSFNFTDEPRFFQYCCSSPDREEDNNRSSGLSSNRDLAKVKALGEYIERFCLDNPNSDFKVASYNEVAKRAIDPIRFLNFRDKDMSFRQKDYVKKIRETPISWVEGRNITNNKCVLIPAQLIYINYPFKEPLIRPRISTGAAAHETLEDALLCGILECIERDSFMLRYYCRDSLPKIKLNGKLLNMEKYFQRYFLDLGIFETTTDLEVPSFICINIDKTGIGPAISVGLKAGLSPREAITGSIIESQKVRQWIRYSYVQDRKPKITKPEEIEEIKDRGYFWYGLNKIDKLDFLLKSPKNKRISDIKSPTKSCKGLVEHLASKGLEVFYVDITSKEIQDAGFKVIKSIIPELHPLYLDEKFPCLDSKRLNKYLNEREINSVPHPFI